MAGKKYYGVKYNDGKSEVFDDWSVCKKNILGVKGVVYKGFPTIEEARAFIDMDLGDLSDNGNFETDLAVYVDGSYRDEIYSYGFVIVDIKKDMIVHEKFGRGKDLLAAKLRNVSGEMKGAMEAITYCINNGIREITLCYDYSGIEMWALGIWKRNNEYTRKYHEFYQARQDRIRVVFKKIKGHSGNKWNEHADQLAKAGLEV